MSVVPHEVFSNWPLLNCAARGDDKDDEGGGEDEDEDEIARRSVDQALRQIAVGINAAVA